MHDSHARSVHEPLAADQYVLPPSWQGLKQQILYLAQFGGGVQVIEGITGAGKTTFAAWLNQDQAALSLSVVEVAGHATGQSLFLDLLRQLGLRPQPSAGLGELLVMLRGYVQSLHRDGSRAVVLMDDAHLIVDADLAALMSVMQGGSDSGFGLHLILMAEPGLTARIDQLQLLDVVVHDMTIPALSPAEAQSLVSQYSGEEIDTATAQTLWHQSQGIPGKIIAALRVSPQVDEVEEVDEAVPPAHGASRSPIRTWPKAHIAAVAFLLAALIWAFAAQQDEAEPVVTRVDVSGLIEQSSERQPASAPVNVPAPVTVQPERPVSLPSPPASPPETGSAPATAETAPTLDSQPQEQRRESSSSQVVPDDRLEAAADAQPRREESPANSVPVEQSQEQVPQDRPSTATELPTTEPDLVAQSEKRLLAYPAHAYVLQLMASAAPEVLLNFVASQPNRDHLLVYRARRNGKLLHILVEGFYADKSAATAAIANLPPAQRKSGPWPKRIEQIHQDIGADRPR